MVYIPDTLSIVNGITATLIMISGFAIGISMWLAMRHSDSKLLPYQGAFSFALGTYYSGITLSFFSIIFTQYNIANNWIVWMSYTVSPIGVGFAMYVGFSMIKPKLAKPMAWSYGCSAVIHWASLWFNWLGPATIARWDPTLLPAGLPSYIYGGVEIPAGKYGISIPNTLVDVGMIPENAQLAAMGIHASLAYWMTMIYLLSYMVILGGGFIYLAFHSSGEVRSRSIKYAYGIIIFTLCGYVDSAVDPAGFGVDPGLFMVIVRLVMFSSYVVLYMGMKPPKSVSAPVKAKDYYPT